jgi:hypothetical protein
MADRKTTDHTAITAANVAVGDVFEIVDISDTTDAATGTNKKITSVELKKLVLPELKLIGVTANRRHGNQRFSSNAFITVAMTANQLLATPLWIERETTIDKLGFEITTGTTGKMWVAIYSQGADGFPSALVAFSGEQTITAAAVYEGLSVASVTLQPGMYWIACLTNTANTLRTVTATNTQPFMGAPSTIGSNLGTAYFVNLTYQATPPDPFTGGGTVSNAGLNAPFLFFRAI